MEDVYRSVLLKLSILGEYKFNFLPGFIGKQAVIGFNKSFPNALHPSLGKK